MSIQVTSTPSLVPSAPPSGGAATDARQCVNANGTSGGMVSGAGSVVPPTDAGPVNKAAQAVSVQARQMASVQSGGLSGLMADLSQAVEAHGADLPEPVQNAIQQLFSLQVSAENPPSAEDIQAAFDRSGLFTESRLAGQLNGATSTSATASAIPADIKSLLLVLHQSLSDWANDLGDASASSTTQTQGGTNSSAQSSGYSATGQQDGASSSAQASSSAPETSGAVQSGMVSAVAATAGRSATAAGSVTSANSTPTTALAASGPDVATSASSPAVPSGTSMLLGRAALLAAAEVADARAEVTNTLLSAAYGGTAASPANGAAAASAGQPDGTATGSSLMQSGSGNLPAGTASSAQVSSDVTSAAVAASASPVEQTGLVANGASPATASSAANASGNGGQTSSSSAPPASASGASSAPSGVGTGAAAGVSASVVAGGPGLAGLATGLVPGTTVAAPQVLPGMVVGTMPVAASQVPAAGVASGAVDSDAALPSPPAAAPLTGVKPALQAAAQDDVLETALAMFSDPRLASQAAAAMLTGSGTAVPLARAMSAVDALAAFFLQQQGDMSEDDGGLTAPPPFRGGPTTAQGATASALPEGDDLAAVARHLLSGSEAALAHQKLLQMASLPDTEKASQSQPSQNHWMFEIPLSTPQGTAVAQFAIDRDGGGEDGTDEDKPVWRVRFAVDVEPLGPVQAQLALCGGQTWVTLWANRPASLERLRAGADTLSDAMADEAFETEIAFHPVAVPKKSGSGRFVDHTS